MSAVITLNAVHGNGAGGHFPVHSGDGISKTPLHTNGGNGLEQAEGGSAVNYNNIDNNTGNGSHELLNGRGEGRCPVQPLGQCCTTDMAGDYPKNIFV